MPTRRSSKYQPLGDYLAAQPPGTVTVTLSLPEIEGLLGRELPLSAHGAGYWWANDTARRPAGVWQRAGWHVTHVQLREVPSAITFARVVPESTA